MLPLALLYLPWVYAYGQLVFSQLDPFALGFLIGTGVVTAVVLLFFATDARRISLAKLGMLQYISPTLPFFCGIFVFHEAMDANRLIGHLWVCLGLPYWLIPMRVKPCSSVQGYKRERRVVLSVLFSVA